MPPIWKAIDEHVERHPERICLLLLLAFFASRLPGLLALPPFEDEGLSLPYAKELLQLPPNIQFVLGNHGRFMLAAGTAFAAALVSLPSAAAGAIGAGADWFAAGRVATMLAGAGAMLGCFRLGKELYSARAGMLSAILYILLPLAYFHDRIQMSDTFLTAFGVWTVILALRLVRWNAGSPLALSATMGAASLSKVEPALFFVAIPLWSWVWFARGKEQARGSLSVIARSYLLLGLGALLLAALLGPSGSVAVVKQWAHYLAGDQFAHARTLNAALLAVGGNVSALPGWLLDYLTLPGLALLLMAAIASVTAKDRRLQFLLISAGAFAFAFLVSPGSVMPRYIVPTMAFLPVAVARGLELTIRGWWVAHSTTLRQRTAVKVPAAFLSSMAAIGLLATSVHFQWLATTSPELLPLPALDRYQYVQGWPAGYGFREALQWVQSDAGPGSALVMTRVSGGEVLGGEIGVDVLRGAWWNDLAGPYAKEKLGDPARRVYVLASLPGDRLDLAQTVKDVVLERMVSYQRPGGVSSVDVYRAQLSDMR